MLELNDIKKDYVSGSTTVSALKGINLRFRDCEFVSILGQSGCGKTTMLNIIGGLDKYTSGDLKINGVSTKNYKDRDWDFYRNNSIGFVFQSYNLIPHQTVLRVSDGILDGLNFSKLAIIISERSKEIAGSIMKNMERGVTAVKSVGMYSGTERDMLFCVVPRKEIIWLRDIVREYDKQAFLIVSDVKEVFGEGFIEDISQK